MSFNFTHFPQTEGVSLEYKHGFVPAGGKQVAPPCAVHDASVKQPG